MKPIFLFCLALFCLSCHSKSSNTTVPKAAQPKRGVKKPIIKTSVPEAHPDSLYAFVVQQVRFGPRIPQTPPHQRCGDWIVKKFRSFGLKVIEQKAVVKDYRNQNLTIRNIIAAYQPHLKQRIILCAHWDTRPFADRDSLKKHAPVPGANDGASGVAVLLELARLIAKDTLPFGIDFICWDAEDMGLHDVENSFCLGSQYWARHPHVPGYRAQYAINLDMVGAKDAQFPQEGFSRFYAPELVEQLWSTAQTIGYGHYFIYYEGAEIIDDHYYLNTLANIPSVNIIHRIPGKETFFPQWHTTKDDTTIISKETLKAVAQTLLYFLYIKSSIM